MRRIAWLTVIVIVAVTALAGCGKKDAGDVANKLNEVLNNMSSYQGIGEMVLYTGKEPQKYSVEVWYQTPNYYRIALTNDSKDITQIVLKNDDGVFVLTPHLNKSFRFQSDWPENQGQVYLYHTLVDSILKDKDRQFVAEKNAYVFDVAADYPNASMVRQKIWIDKENYAPKKMEVSDASSNVMVSVNFTKFHFDKKFDKGSFDMDRNMTSWNVQQETAMAISNSMDDDEEDQTLDEQEQQTDNQIVEEQAGHDHGSSNEDSRNNQQNENEENDAKEEDASNSVDGLGDESVSDDVEAGDENSSDDDAEVKEDEETFNEMIEEADHAAHANSQSIGIVTPDYIPSGTELAEMREIQLGDQLAVLLRYSGDPYNFTLTESRPKEQSVSVLQGTVVDLGFAFAVVIGQEQYRTMTWTTDGIEYRLSSGDMPVSEMIKVAQSTLGNIGK